MSFQSAGYQLLPVLPELVLAAGAMVLPMLGAYRGGEATTKVVTTLAVCLLVVTGALELMLPSTLGMMVLISAGDLIMLYLGLELMSLALYVVAASNRDNAKSTEAGLKYFVLGALSSGMLLYGASLVYGFTGTVSFAGIAAATKVGTSIGIVSGLVFLLAGLSFKVSAV